MSGAANRTRGANAERSVVNFLRLAGFPHARRYLAGDGRQPGDIDFRSDVCLEVKDRKASAWPTWREQALAEARPNQLVVVVRRVRGVTYVGHWEAQWSCRDCLRLDLDSHSPSHPVTWCSRTNQGWCAGPFVDLVLALPPHIQGMEHT